MTRNLQWGDTGIHERDFPTPFNSLVVLDNPGTLPDHLGNWDCQANSCINRGDPGCAWFTGRRG